MIAFYGILSRSAALRVSFSLIVVLFLAGCRAAPSGASGAVAEYDASLPDHSVTPAADTQGPATPAPIDINSPGGLTGVVSATVQAVAATTTPTLLPAPFTSPTALSTPTATLPINLEPCRERSPADDDLLVFLTRTYGLSRRYEPPDLVPLSDFFPFEVTLGYPTMARAIIIEPLRNMIAAMQAEGLEPQIISAYRSYSEQAMSYNRWLESHPDRVDQLSAPPGFSEHQLGTTIDFGSPRLKEYIDDETLQFHTFFYKTPEGIWLRENAHLFGFTLSYPPDAQELTDFFYEPWHFRFIGVEMAVFLEELDMSLTEYQLITEPAPCRPAEGS